MICVRALEPTYALSLDTVIPPVDLARKPDLVGVKPGNGFISKSRE